jgi:glycosyltransferase involved in cell wall biosynthesis
MTTIFFDGSVCLNREGACYKYYAALATRFAAWGYPVIFTPAGEGVLADLEKIPGISVMHRTVPKAPSWLPKGAWRKHLSRFRAFLERKTISQTASASTASANPEDRVFLSFYYNLPFDPSLRSISLVLDVIDEIFPELDSDQNRRLRQKRFQATEHAAKILCISETTRRDFLSRYPQFASKTATAPIGVDVEFFQTHVADAKAQLSALGIHRPYLLHVGGRLNHKNFPLLARAYQLGGFSKEYDLVCTGEAFAEEERTLFKDLGIEVKHIRFPNEPTLRVLYQQAALLAYPSRYEGFGIPPLEAMASGCPVVAARGGSIPEISGSASWLVSPDDPEEMALAMRAMLRPSVRAEFAAKGRAHVQNYRWDPIARRILDVFATRN